ncbi:hypothetical protein JOC78_003532 [Bacillus ectoiniformans]|nr:hypothetical protein [Bacillus ectoiniformans]
MEKTTIDLIHLLEQLTKKLKLEENDINIKRLLKKKR